MKRIGAPDTVASRLEEIISKGELSISAILEAIADNSNDNAQKIVDTISALSQKNPDKYNLPVAIIAMQLCLIALGYKEEFEEVECCREKVRIQASKMH